MLKTIFFAAIVAIIWGAISYHSPSKQQRENTYSNQNDKDKKASTPVGKSDNKSQCTAAEGKEKQKSFWEFSLTDTVIAIFTIVLAGVGYCQWQQIKRTVDSTERLEAPYLIPELLSVEDEIIDNQFRPMAVYTFRNHGRTPAIIRRFQDTMRIRALLPETEDGIWGNETISNRPGQYIPVGPAHIPITQGQQGLRFNCRLAEGDVVNIGRLSELRHYIIGRVQYQDIFRKNYIQGFCIQILAHQRINTPSSNLRNPVWQNVIHTTTGDTVFNYRHEQKD